MEDVYIFSVESSCDETACAIVKNGKEIIGSVVLSQIDIHKKFGGVVPEVASRNHVKNITIIFAELLEEADMKFEDITAFAVTAGPGLTGSLLVGVEAVKTLSFIYNKPLIPIHHIAGHIYANNIINDMKFPLIVLVVSGGHTELIYMKEHYDFKIIGSTLDDAVGECYDKVARVLNLSYPGGPKIDELATTGQASYELPKPLDDNSYNFSFSGLKSAIINLVHNEEQRGNDINKGDLATSFQNVVVDTITKKTIKSLKEYDVKYLLLAGGVAANKGLRGKLKELCLENNIDLSMPPFEYCTDNAVMIGIACYFAYKKGIRGTLDLNARSNVDL